MARFGSYELFERLGVGGMGEVFRARALGSDTDVALKRLLPHVADDADFMSRFLEEARLASSLQHPNIARTLELANVEGRWFVVMEFIDGRDLRTLAARAPVSWPLACHLISAAAAALAHAHERRDAHGRPMHLVHGDVSPHNLLVSFDGAVKLIDFGVARAARSGAAEATLGGKFGYLAPETLEGDGRDARSDLFSLGVVAWELLTGHRLFDADTDAEMVLRVTEDDVPAPSKINAAIPPAVDTAVLGLLVKKPDGRTKTAAAARAAFDEALEGAVRPTQRDVAVWAKAAMHGATHTPQRKPAAPRSGETPTSSFIGRATELAHLAAHVATGAQTVEFVGEVGSGRHRLAAEFARQHPAVQAVIVISTERKTSGAVVDVGPLAEAGALLAERLKNVRPRLGALAPDVVSALALRVGGHALSLELVAGQVEHDARALLAELPQQPLDVARWAVGRLSVAERLALQQIARRGESATLEALEAGLDFSSLDEPPFALDVLQTLRERWLLSATDVRGELRFSVHPLVALAVV